MESRFSCTDVHTINTKEISFFILVRVESRYLKIELRVTTKFDPLEKCILMDFFFLAHLNERTCS